MLAVKFKLPAVRSPTIRYEVIYKNLLRDVRKYLTSDFRLFVSPLEKTKKLTKESRAVILIENASHYLREVVDREIYTLPGVQFEELLFVFLSMIFPREILKVIQDAKY